MTRDTERMERRVQGRTESLARQFDRVLAVMESWGYVSGWSMTATGERLARIYHESDLLIAECIDTGIVDGLNPPELAALMSVFTFEARGQAEPDRSFPTSRLRQRWAEIEQVSLRLNQAEHAGGLPLTRRPDPGFMVPAFAWAGGDELSAIIEEQEISGGDFVRNVKQLIDLLRQLGDLAPDRDTALAARRAADQLFRGVVAASSVVSA